MNKDEILEKSRKENNNKDLAEINVLVQAGNIAGRVGACVCGLITIIALKIANIFLCSPWIIYFSILGTSYLVRFVKVKRKSDLFLSCLLYLMCIISFIFLVIRLVGEAV